MDKKRKSRIGKWVLRVVLALLALVLVFSAVYLIAFPRITFVADSAFLQVYSSSDIRRLRLDYAAHGRRLSVLKLADSAFDSPESFSSALTKTGGKAVVLSPLASEYSIQEGIDVSALLARSIVIGIHTDTDNTCFDYTVVPDEKQGWTEAATSLAAETSEMSQNVALVYESETISYAQDIISCFPDGHVSEFRRISGTSLFQSNTLKALDEQGIVIAMCPYVSSFHRFFSKETSVSWIVDYRFALVVPEDNLYGVVVPDFRALIDVAGKAEKGARDVDVLPFVYVKK